VKLRFIEADIRDDFSGEYFARKVYVLANECGLDIKFSDVQVESLVRSCVLFCAQMYHDSAHSTRFDIAGKICGARCLR